VETAIAKTGSLQERLAYTGTTEPVRQVSLRSQVAGQLLNLAVDVGDPVAQGQVLAQLDDRLLAAELSEATAELAALRSEVAQAQAEVSDAQAQVAQAQFELQQAQADAERLQSLAKEGVIPEQNAEQAQTASLTAEQAVRSAQERVRTRRQAVIAAQGRVRAQAATVARAEERRTYAVLTSPIHGIVLDRVTEPGNLIQPGDAILTLGDFSAIKVVVQMSELELGGIRLGQPVRVRLDAIPNQEFSGQVTRISPAADPTARLIPIEVTIPNRGDCIGSGLLARVSFMQPTAEHVVIPETAVHAGDASNSGTGSGENGADVAAAERQNAEPTTGIVFVVNGTGDAATVAARTVKLGDRTDGQVEILSGLEPGDPFVVRSSDELQDGTPVRLSFTSEGQE
jgi:multidrug efflux pump subunit AcrA (membrane-fusion protein)